ncbi:amino acid permease [Ktedonosporobacter rubrisoli]|uniref:Amino acid permease n=1 Tax=Ktedonosporobacter rubrisoli TaxID=2509675 RepID=A0A4P6JJ68_KTERU|nr:amino acid permease [Ktedonosporobacter rubrisoli]QBD74706.1 amino acid permease [Ktedonosporobacter rubrisoli]
MSLWRTKSIAQCLRDTEAPEHALRKELGPLDLTVFGIGVVVGTGIFVLTGVAAATKAGPAIAISFVVSGIACALAALCYAEFASAVPVAGSAYTFAYATLGEFLAWIIGWDLILELSVGAAAVSIGWSQYIQEILKALGITLPAALTNAPPVGILNLPAALIALFLTLVLTRGIRISSSLNVIVTTIKLAVVVFFIVVGAFFIKSINWSPFIPPAQPITSGGGTSLETPLVQLLFGLKQSSFGLTGIVSGAATVFFAYIGFDVVATAAEETRHPQRDLPIGIICSLTVCTILYILVSLVMTGIVPYPSLNTAAPMATAFVAIGLSWAAGLVSVGAVCGLTAVILVLLLGQSRVFFAMSRDHLLPSWFSRVHPRFGTPYRITLCIGIVVAIVAAVTPINAVAELVNIGTLLAFVLVSAAVVILRRTRPDLPRAFRTPLVPFVPILAIIVCGYLMISLPLITWLRFVIWLILGIVIYALYGMRHSRLAGELPKPISTATAVGDSIDT